MSGCCVPCCSSPLETPLFSFPDDDGRYLKWIRAVKREDLLEQDYKTVRSAYKICALHFCESHKYKITKDRMALKKVAYPSMLLPVGQVTSENGTAPCYDITVNEHRCPDECKRAPIKKKKKKKSVEEEEDEYVNFNDVCRVCLSSDDELTDINKVSFEGLSMQDIFEQYIAIKIYMEDDLPKQICNMCLYELCRVYLFINNCREADTKLKELVSGDRKEDTMVCPQIVATSENGETEDNGDNTNVMTPLKVPEPGPPFICDNCSAHFETLADIKSHRKLFKHYIVRQYLCKFCSPSKVYTYRRWKNHVRVHTGEKPYECHICGKRFSLNCNRLRHLVTHTGIKPYSCNYCGKEYSQKANLKNHQLIEHSEDLRAEKGPFVCVHCQKVFKRRTALAHHTVIHFDKKFLCNKCGNSFHYGSQLNRHLKRHDRAGGKTSANPSLCIRKHPGSKPYECEHCQRRFVQKAHLITHMKTHTGERPFACSYCHKTFALNGNLTVHMRKHTGENPYVCDICVKGFADSSSLKRHRKKHSQWCDLKENN